MIPIFEICSNQARKRLARLRLISAAKATALETTKES
jgi:DNA-binding TFAR19-related protein (PDSD5 family)